MKLEFLNIKTIEGLIKTAGTPFFPEEDVPREEYNTGYEHEFIKNFEILDETATASVGAWQPEDREVGIFTGYYEEAFAEVTCRSYMSKESVTELLLEYKLPIAEAFNSFIKIKGKELIKGTDAFDELMEILSQTLDLKIQPNDYQDDYSDYRESSKKIQSEYINDLEFELKKTRINTPKLSLKEGTVYFDISVYSV